MALTEMTADTQFDEGWEAEEADKQEQDPAADPEEDRAGEKPDTESNKVELEDKEEPETKGEAGDDTQDFYKFDDPIKKRIQKVKTLEGMYNSEKKRQTQLEKELADLKTQMSVRVDEKPKEEVAAKKEEGIDDDFEKYRDNGEIVSWMDSLPAYKKEGYKKAYSDGSTEEVIDLIGTFKEAMGYAEKSNETPKAQVGIKPAGGGVKKKKHHTH